MIIADAEFKKHVDRYLELAETEDIYISSNGGVKVKLESAVPDRLQAMESLMGTIPADITLEEVRQERLGKF